ncbi:MAG: hypothetical protein RL376_7 [Verrucomicrobiota bacterium]
MPMVYRLTRVSRQFEAFTGEGAKRFGGRWNSPGLRVVYTSGARSLALLETLVHLDTAAPLPLFSFVQVELAPEDIEALPPDAFARRDDLAQSRALGDRWLRGTRSLALAVPSVIVPQEFNYLLNPAHPRFATLRPAPPVFFELDQRLHLAPPGGVSSR